MPPLYAFPNLRFNNQPDPALFGISENVHFMGHGIIFPKVDGEIDASGWIDEERMEARLMQQPAGRLMYLNIESGNNGGSWRTAVPVPTGGMEFRPDAMQKRIRLLNWCRRIRPDLMYGYYKEPACWAGPVLNDPDHWFDNVVRPLKPMLELQDYISPQCYFDHGYRDGVHQPGRPVGLEQSLLWMERHFQALRFVAPTTPIMPIIWPWWLDKGRPEPMSGIAWRTLLSYAFKHTDGVFLWWDGGRYREWNPRWEWWKTTLDLIRE